MPPAATYQVQNWVRGSNGQIIGIRYWSSQGSTNGIAYNTEYFDTSSRGNVYFNQVYIARVQIVEKQISQELTKPGLLPRLCYLIV